MAQMTSPIRILSALMLLLAGCGALVPQPVDEYVDGRLKIVYWEKWTGREGQAIRRVVDRFNEMQDQIYVHLITMSQIDQKALVAIAGGNPPDLVGLFSVGIPAFAEKGALLPLTPFMEETGMRQEDFLPAFIAVNTFEGELYGLPTTPSTLALHWNKRLFREAGLDPDQPPRTLAELDAMAERLTRHDDQGRIAQMGFLPSEPGWWPWIWGHWFGGSLFDGDRFTITSPENLAGFRWVQQHTERYGAEALRRFQSGIAGNFDSPQNAFFAERLAMVLQGVWMASFIQQYAPDIEWGAAPFPTATGDRPGATLADCDSIVIPVGARHPREAFRFIQFLCSPEGSELLNLGQGKYTPLRQVSPGFFENHPHPKIKLFYDLAAGPYTFHPPILGTWFELNDEMQSAFDMIIFGLDTPERALDRVQQRMETKWRRVQYLAERRRAAEKEQQ